MDEFYKKLEHLMNMQLDVLGGAILKSSMENLGVAVHLEKSTAAAPSNAQVPLGELAKISFSKGPVTDFTPPRSASLTHCLCCTMQCGIGRRRGTFPVPLEGISRKPRQLHFLQSSGAT
jgi:NAD(P)H-nitrite reductase large subunit